MADTAQTDPQRSAATPHGRREYTQEQEPEALLRLVAAGGSAAVRRALLDRHGNPSAALNAGPAAWRASGLDARQIAALRRDAPEHPRLSGAHAWLAESQHAVIGWHHADYPPLLRETASPPLALFVDGDAGALWRPTVAIVGSRAATPGGCAHAAEFAAVLAGAGLVVASGLATGIDAAAHRAAIAAGSGSTVAVLGCGPDIAYPASHRQLLAAVAANGCVVSEHLPGTRARREHFPSRNRIIAGLSLGILVVEAGERSGALITARLAAEAGREVFALPGSIRNPLARGCHRLIRDGATLVESPQEVLDLVAPIAGRQARDLRTHLIRGQSCPPAAGTYREQTGGPDYPVHYNQLWQVLDHDPTPMDELVQRSGLTAAELSSILLVMELEGRVVAQHGRYSRK